MGATRTPVDWDTLKLNYLRAYTRSFENMGVPMVMDQINSDEHLNVRVESGRVTTTYCIQAGEDVAAGSELLVSYDYDMTKNPWQFFSQYGFWLNKHSSFVGGHGKTE